MAQAAFEIGERVCENGQIFDAGLICDSGEFVFEMRCEMIGNVLLIIAQNVDDENAALLEGVMAAGVFFDAD